MVACISLVSAQRFVATTTVALVGMAAVSSVQVAVTVVAMGSPTLETLTCPETTCTTDQVRELSNESLSVLSLPKTFIDVAIAAAFRV